MTLLFFTSAVLGEQITKDKFPRLFDYISRMLQNEAVKKTALPTDMHLKFINGFVSSGNHDYSVVDITGNGVVMYTKK